MKKMKAKFIIPAGLSAIAILAACSKDFLNKPPLGTLNPEIVASETGIQGILIGAYSLVDGEGATSNGGDGFASGASNWILGGVASDDAYKGSDPSDVSDAAPMEDWSITPTNGAIPQKWNVCYAGAQRCNDVLRTLPLATDIPADVATGIIAQARFLRGFYHFELKKIFGNIIYADENLTLETTTNQVDVWPMIEADLNFAADNLPDTWSDPGRANKWAAKALLAKCYMYEHKLSDAYTLLKEIIPASYGGTGAGGKTAKGEPYALTPNYYSNFNPAQKNSAESVFAAQTSVQDGSSVDWGGDPNGNYGDILNFPYTGGPGACCGFYNPSQDLANAFKTDAAGLPLLDTWYTGNNVSNGATPYTGTLDPRIDWTMGRKGIPYLDWGLHPGDAWIRNPGADGHFSPIKNVYAASQKDSYTDVGSAYWGPTELVANNVNIIRFADVLLWAAECAADAGELDAAKGFVNKVRDRALNSAWVKKDASYNAATASYSGGTNADNYKIGLYPSFDSKDYAIKAIRFERRLELAMEGQRFFDLVRYGSDVANSVLNAYYDRERSFMPLKANAHWTPNKNEVFPIPQGQIDNLNSDGTTRLVQNPGY